MSTAREALIAELFQDADALLRRVEELDSGWAAKIEQATRDGAGQAFLAARLNLESVVGEQERRLVDAGRHGAAQIGNQLGSGVAQLIAVNESLERKARRFVMILAMFALIAGTAGGFLGAKLAGV